LRGRRTVLVIAHQLSTVALADSIVVLEGGQVVEQGSPAELRARDGRYARFLRQRSAALGWRIGGAGVDESSS
ncbi:ABC transporter ATP-binding protein, partial [Acinetobacter baumannii]|nr:ABC transporter ATP-binding protein [Acinetobacter baumannii]